MAADTAGTLPFADTDVLLYLLSADHAKASRAEALLARRVVISVQVLNEFANVATRKFGLGWLETKQALLDIRRFAEVCAVTMETHDHGLALAERHGLSLYDAMIAAAALEAGCSTLFSEDLLHGQRLERRLTIRNPFA
jgi:predicted nucleic acid-binding protein